MERKRGRPIGSDVRQRLIDILHFRKKAYGYDLYKDYCALFPEVSLRLIYYHLGKGLSLGELEIESVRSEKGSYSWGGQAEKKYYKLGPKANPRPEKRIAAYFLKKK